MKKKGIVIFVATLVIILVVLGFFLLRKPPEPEKVERLRVGVAANPICALTYIAHQQGFFKRHGLDVTIEGYPAGAYAVDDLLVGKVDVAAAAEFVLALRGFKREDLRGIGTISASDTVEVIVRKDRGIQKPEDLKGKSVGVSKGTVNDFFLSVFLSFNNIRLEEVRTVDLKPDEIVAALSEGKIDAAVNFTLFVDEVKKRMADRVLSWPAQGGRNFYFLLFIKEELVKTRPVAITSFLKGVLEAETFLKKHEKEAQDIMKNILSIDQEALMSTWSRTRFRVSLDQDLLTLMEDEGRWAIKNRVVDAEKIPDYFTLLHVEGLKKIKPEAVGAN
jgi:ABC-type nitrate/sulfonate/bicarbonate transport system substrate-binding protein